MGKVSDRSWKVAVSMRDGIGGRAVGGKAMANVVSCGCTAVGKAIVIYKKQSLGNIIMQDQISERKSKNN